MGQERRDQIRVGDRLAFITSHYLVSVQEMRKQWNVEFKEEGVGNAKLELLLEREQLKREIEL